MKSSFYRQAFQIAWPATVESVFVGVAGLIDTAMVSSLGTTAVAAVGLANQPKFICLSFITSLNVGVTAMISRRIGENREEAVNRCFKQSLFLCLLITLCVCGGSFLFARPFIRAAGAKDDTVDLSSMYFRIVLIGQCFQHLCLTVNTAWRCSGNSRISMYTNLVSSVFNIIFNYLLIGGRFGFPALGVAGAAIATSLGNIIACLLAFLTLFSKNCRFRIFEFGGWLPSADVAKGLWQVSSSSLLEQICLRTGFFIYVLIVANLGTATFATHQICMNITNVTVACFDGFSIAAAALTGRYLGAESVDGAKKSVKACVRMATAEALVLWALFLVFRVQFMGIFSDDPAVIDQGAGILMIVGATMLADVMNSVYAGALRGAGDTRFIAAISLASTTLIRPAVSWILCYPVGLGLVGPWIALFIDLWMRGILSAVHFFRGKWTKIML